MKSFLGILVICALALCAGCASLPQAQLDAVLKDLQGCKRQYNIANSAGTGLPAVQFSASISCEPTIVAPQPPAATVLAVKP